MCIRSHSQCQMGYRWGQSQPSSIHSQTPIGTQGWLGGPHTPPPFYREKEAGSFPSPLHTPSTPTGAWLVHGSGQGPTSAQLGGRGVASPSPPCPIAFWLGPAQVGWCPSRSCSLCHHLAHSLVRASLGDASPFPRWGLGGPLSLFSHLTQQPFFALRARRPSLHGSPSTTAIRQEPDSRGTGTR